MIRIIFGNGDVVDCENIDVIYMDGFEKDKVKISKFEKDKVKISTGLFLQEGTNDIRVDNSGAYERNTNNKTETPDN